MYIHVITLKMFVCFHFYQESEFIGDMVSNQNAVGWMLSDTKESNKMGQKKSCPGLAEEKSGRYQGIDLLLKVDYEGSWSKIHYFKLKSQEKGKKKNLGFSTESSRLAWRGKNAVTQAQNKPEMPWEAFSDRTLLERKIIDVKEASNTGATQSETTGI